MGTILNMKPNSKAIISERHKYQYKNLLLWQRPKDPVILKNCILLAECAAFFKGVLNAIDIPIINNPAAESLAPSVAPFTISM
jgi:hypothetical protein